MKKIMAVMLSLLACTVLLAGCNNFAESNEEQSLKVYSFSGENEYISVSNGVIILDGKEEICMLDFAYIYAISYKLFTCNCDNMTLVQYDKDYVNLVCPRCHKKYRFADIRRKVTTQAQEEEIGDIRRLGYVLHQASEMVEDNPEFMPVFKKTKPKKKKITVRDKIKQYDRVTKKDPYGEIWDQLHKSKSKEN